MARIVSLLLVLMVICNTALFAGACAKQQVKSPFEDQDESGGGGGKGYE
jgi:hypothetical protein